MLRHRHPPHRRLVIPDHDPIAKGTLRAHIREAGSSVDEFINLLWHHAAEQSVAADTGQPGVIPFWRVDLESFRGAAAWSSPLSSRRSAASKE